MLHVSQISKSFITKMKLFRNKKLYMHLIPKNKTFWRSAPQKNEKRRFYHENVNFDVTRHDYLLTQTNSDAFWHTGENVHNSIEIRLAKFQGKLVNPRRVTLFILGAHLNLKALKGTKSAITSHSLLSCPCNGICQSVLQARHRNKRWFGAEGWLLNSNKENTCVPLTVRLKLKGKATQCCRK